MSYIFGGSSSLDTHCTTINTFYSWSLLSKCSDSLCDWSLEAYQYVPALGTDRQALEEYKVM